MQADACVAMDALVNHVDRHPDETVDYLLVEAGKHPAFQRLQDRGPAEFLRSLRGGPEGDLLATALLRLLATRHASIDESEYRSQIASFLDGQYGEPLRAYYKAPRKRNAYEILNAFTPVIPAVEQKASEIVEAMRHLDLVGAQRQELYKLLNGPAGRVIFRPFLPQHVLDTELSELFTAAIELGDAEDRDAIGVAFSRVGATVLAIENAVDSQPTVYGHRILLGVTDAIQTACRQRLELKSPPAGLVFRESDRPLPLLEPGVTTSLELQVVNEGDASAKDVELSLTALDDGVVLLDEPISIARIEPRKRDDVVATVVVGAATTTARVRVAATWTNLDHTVGQAEHMAVFRAHEVHINWEDLEAAQPFSPYPVENAERLVGRERQLEKLKNQFLSRPLANLYITGQRRIGKTSLVWVLIDELMGAPNVVISKVEMGEARGATGLTTIGTLGRKLAERAIKAAGLQDEVPVPDFSDSLAPLTDVVEKILAWDESLSFIFVIDEFDELPHETYQRNGPGDALFVPMRSLAQKPNVGWLLVGGERMPFIRDEQAARLNTFHELSLDHLSFGDAHGRGFGDLVRKPLPAEFSVDDAAVRYLFEESAGNPHFAKEICAVLFSQATSRRDALVTPVEMAQAVEEAARVLDVELFAHFWEDGIFERDDRSRRRELQRRSYLTACAEVLRSSGNLQDARVRTAAESRDLTAVEVDRLRTEFLGRGILRENGAGELAIGVPFFKRWLEAEGIYRLPPKGIAEKDRDRAAALDARLRISANEVRTLVRRWEHFTYRGQQIGRDAIENWLAQFELPLERRLAFRMLERLRLINEGQVFIGFRQLQRLVARESRVRLTKGQKTLSHLFVSPLGTTGSSGDHFAYLYRQANNIRRDNMFDIDRLIDRLVSRPDVSTVVLVDDFIGSGGSAIKALAPLAERVGELNSRPAVSWFLFALTGMPAGVDTVSESHPAQTLGLRVELSHVLGEADMLFTRKSTVFQNQQERDEAREMLQRYGARTGAPWPLGYGDHAAPVVFPQNCPNNAPAILWADGNGWQPLFVRTAV